MTVFDQSIKIIVFMFMGASVFAQTHEPLAKVEKQSVNAGVQDIKATSQKVVVITGARFAYGLIENWIEEYSKVNPGVQVIIDSRGTNDPLKYDILAEVYEQDEKVKKNREYIYVGRYAILPVANSKSSFATFYGDKGLNKDLINQIFFHDIFSDQEKAKPVKEPFNTFTRMQKAGVPQVFAKYFGHEQKDIKGNAIAGSDAHLVKALLRDSVGVTYLPTPLLYDFNNNKTIEGLKVLPVDFNGNGKVNDEEKFFASPIDVIKQLEATNASDIKNIPIGYLHLSVDKATTNQDSLDFLKWVSEHGRQALHQFGFLHPEKKYADNHKFIEFASKRGTN